MIKTARAGAPATVANVACGFDVLGFAVHEPCDEVTAWRAEMPGVRIKKITGDAGKLPLAPDKNVCGIAVSSLLHATGNGNLGIELELHKGMGIGTGLGSSSASTVAALAAANQLLDRPLDRKDLLTFAVEGEKAACGTGHADNVAPCLLGGFVLIRSYSPLEIVELGTPESLFCAIVSPDVEVRTEDARKILKKQIALKDAVTQWGNIAALVTGVIRSDYNLISRSLNDVIIEPKRADLIPAFKEVKEAALREGVLGCSISGSGPSIFALCSHEATALRACKQMSAVFEAHGITAKTYSSKVNAKGTWVEALD